MMEERSSCVIWEVSRHGHALLANIAAKVRWSDDGTQTLEIPVTCHRVEAHRTKRGANVVLLTDEGTQFDASVNPEELPRDIAAMLGASSSR